MATGVSDTQLVASVPTPAEFPPRVTPYIARQHGSTEGTSLMEPNVNRRTPDHRATHFP
jgi:hypothetical protein